MGLFPLNNQMLHIYEDWSDTYVLHAVHKDLLLEGTERFGILQLLWFYFGLIWQKARAKSVPRGCVPFIVICLV